MLTLQDTASSAGQKDTGYSATGTTLLFFFSHLSGLLCTGL